jgi:hypothetical protein
MVMAPDKSRFQRHSAHLRTRIIGSLSPSPDSTIEENGEPFDAPVTEGAAEATVSADAPETSGILDDGEGNV